MPKYLSLSEIRNSIESLNRVHPFFRTTFVVLKRNNAPVGRTFRIALDGENKELLQRSYRPHPHSDYYFLPYKTKPGFSPWKKPKYPSTSLQATNTQTFSPALLHINNEKQWGWSNDYVQFLKNKLPTGKIPLWSLAVWLFREEPWDNQADPQDIIERFILDLSLTDLERHSLFDETVPDNQMVGEIFSLAPASWSDVLAGYPPPEDVPPDAGATLRYLELSYIGPARTLIFEPSSRLNIITGDNGLGKTFLLDVVWWALTREWSDQKVIPLSDNATPPQIKFTVATGPATPEPSLATFNSKTFDWKIPPVEAVAGLVVYARVDGSFAVWDPANLNLSGRGIPGQQSGVSFTKDDIWRGDSQSKIEGLLRDWVRWQRLDLPAFDTFKKVVERTRPPDLGEFSIGEPQRVRGLSMEIPTINHPYGRIPVTYESAGIKRILTLAYLIVWAWEEHKVQAKVRNMKEERQMVIIIDEAEAHLHPRWQRVIVPSLVGIASDIHEALSIQYFIASHSPLVLASLEPIWNQETDCLAHLQLNEKGRVAFSSLPFELRGTADSWLQSPSFDDLHPGSEDAEYILDEAKAILGCRAVDVSRVREITNRLSRLIAPENPFWLRWILFLKKHDIRS